MDRRAAAQYLTKLFGKASGYVAVAYKDQDESWQEHQFKWPEKRTDILAWAEIHQDANVFVCPALREDAHTRKKGDGIHLRWLWADVDWDKVPEDKRAVVAERITSLGTYVVASGTGKNRHVYVDLGEEVSVAEHYRLNTGLREYLYADAKHADNSLLRLPGTTNWKTDAGSPVRMAGNAAGRVNSPAKLLELRTFAKISVMAMADAGPGGVEWAMVDVSGLERRAKRFAQMDVDEARSRYGTRHEAVWAITGELHKMGLDPDHIHTLMDRFPPAIQKRDEEHGAYDVHKDVERRLAKDRLNAEGPNGDPESAGEEISEEEDRELRFKADVERIIWNEDVRDAAKIQRAVDRHTEPPDDLSESLSDALSVPAAPVQWLVEGLASAEANIIITGQYKAGKTMLMVASLIPALADGHQFLGRFDVHVPDGGIVVGHWNLEMSKTDLIDKYMRPVGIQNVDNVKLAHWRGQSVNLLTEPGKETAINWLKSRGVQVWTIDSWAQIARMAGINTNDNDEVYALLGAIDEIKYRAGVKVCFMLGHTGRNSDDKASSAGGLNPTRGASAVDEHVDARWVMTRDAADVRFLATEGREVEVIRATPLELDEDTNRMMMGSGTKQTLAQDGLIQGVVVVLAAEGPGRGLNQTELVKRLRAGAKIGVSHARQTIQDAVDAGFVEVRIEQPEAGKRAMHMHYLSGGRPEGDRARNATPALVNVGSAKERWRKERS